MNYKKLLMIFGLAQISLIGCQKAKISPVETDISASTNSTIEKVGPLESAARVSTVPSGEASFFGINTSYYKKYTFIGTSSISIPIVSAANVSDAALDRAATLCNLLVRTYPSYALYSMRAQRIYIAIFANSEYPNVLPGWPTGINALNYGGGFGPTSSFRVCGIHEGDILKNSFDRYPLENIVVHEFSHAIKNFALEIDNSNFRASVQTIFDNARRNNKWSRTYAATNAEEYWSECVQSYFNINTNGPVGGDGVHNDINTRAELQNYDVGIYNLINTTYNSQVLPSGNW
jgi:hypothetical protein